MRTAKHDHTTPPPAPQPIISGQTALALADTIARLKGVAAEAQDRLYLSDGPPHPDHVLLDAASDALRLMREEKELRAADRALFERPGFGDLPETEKERRRALSKENIKEIGKISGMFRAAMCRVRKEKATTPAGVYAKALICRQSQTGASMVAMSLAEDLVSTPSLRASIWPSGEVLA